ncbi:ead/Ea22-like family protein [Citrobacter freundii]|uniref:ead/Ea22-like family protein n=1 Tax=Citrobacter freundii TaxID=546 RepID=UPI00397851E6
MTALNKQALREAAQEEIMLRSVSDTSDAWQDEASPEAVLALLDELEKEKGYASAYEGEKWHYHQLAESEGERANQAETKLEAAEKRIAEHNFENRLLANADRDIKALRERIAELEARTVTLPQYRNSPDMHTKQFYEAIGFNQGLDIFIEALRAAGIGVKGE